MHLVSSQLLLSKKGLSLLETIVMLIIIGVLVVVAIPVVGNINNSARIRATEAELTEIQRAIMGDPDFRGYSMDNKGQLPASLTDLLGTAASTYNPFTQTTSRGGYLHEIDDDSSGTADVLEDAWGNVYDWDSSSGQIYSFGPDQADDSGGADDILMDVDG